VRRIGELGLDPRPLIEQLMRGWFITTLRDGTFHADVHAGNLLLLRDGRVGVVDWGIVGRLDARTHRFFRRMIEGALGDESAWHDVAVELLQAYGPALRDDLGFSEASLAEFARAVIAPTLVDPIGTVKLGSFLAAMQGKIAEAQGHPVARHGWRDTMARLRRQRALHVGVEEYGGRGTSFDRGTFLLTKQLVYFERYGKMFIGERSLLADRAFIEGLLAEGLSTADAAQR
jgi:hypothetical protein